MMQDAESIDIDTLNGQNHDLYHEIPDCSDRIDELCQSDQHFARLVEEYNEINREVIRIEQLVEARDHFYLEQLKKKRLQHLDELYNILHR